MEVPAVGERVSVRLDDRELIGFVTRVDAAELGLVDRRGVEHEVGLPRVVAWRPVGVSLGRDPLAFPRPLLDGLAARAGASGTPWVCRISTLLAGRTPPASVPPRGEWADFDGVRARFEGEWVTLAGASVGVAECVAAAWWATRMGARSIQVRGEGSVPDALADAGFVRHGEGRPRRRAAQ